MQLWSIYFFSCWTLRCCRSAKWNPIVWIYILGKSWTIKSSFWFLSSTYILISQILFCIINYFISFSINCCHWNNFSLYNIINCCIQFLWNLTIVNFNLRLIIFFWYSTCCQASWSYIIYVYQWFIDISWYTAHSNLVPVTFFSLDWHYIILTKSIDWFCILWCSLPNKSCLYSYSSLFWKSIIWRFFFLLFFFFLIFSILWCIFCLVLLLLWRSWLLLWLYFRKWTCQSLFRCPSNDSTVSNLNPISNFTNLLNCLSSF